MRTVSTAEMRELDRRTIEEFGTPGEILMERAGLGVALCVERLASICSSIDPSVVLVAGKGNNGGDVFVTASLLKKRGFDVAVFACASCDDIKGDALVHLNIMKEQGVVLHELPDEHDWSAGGRLEELKPENCDIVVDGVLGTGISGAVRGAAAGAIKFINSLASGAFVIAVDLPSGMDSDTGQVDGDVVSADVTVTMGYPKKGMAAPCAIEHTGSVEVVDIGIPEEYVEELSLDCELIVSEDFENILPERAWDSHKGDYGHALLIGGANGYAGAISMAAAASTRSGVGLVTVVAPKCVAAGVCAVSPESMIHWAEETEKGSLSSDALTKLDIDISKYDAVLIGPGMTIHEDGKDLIRQVLRSSKGPVILDADALNLCADDNELIQEVSVPWAITPHPGEMARLSGVSSQDVQSDRLRAAGEFAAESGAVVILKGAGTVICGKGSVPCINVTGNPGMAAGGMGDVLAGLLTGLAAQGINLFDAAKLAVFLHGKAADRLAWSTSQAGLVASDLIKEIPYVLGTLG